MNQILGGLVLAVIFTGGGYYAGMNHYADAEKDAAIEALATNLTATAVAKESHKRNNKILADRLATERTAWRIYEKDNLDRCARTNVNDPRLVRLLLDLPEGNTLYPGEPASGIHEADTNPPPEVLWGEVGSYTFDLAAGLRSCNINVQGIIDWCKRVGCKEFPHG